MWIGDAAQIAAMRVRKQKTDRQDAQFLLKLMMEDRFPRVWMSSLEDRDLQQLLWHRHRVVQMRTRVLNQLQAIAMNEGIQRKGGLRSAQGRKRLEQLPRGPWAALDASCHLPEDDLEEGEAIFRIAQARGSLLSLWSNWKVHKQGLRGP